VTQHVLVIGGQRCGTTLLYEVLAAHPEIAVARPRRPEPKVFLSDEKAQLGIDWYHQTYFAHAKDETVLAEKSTSYLEDAAAAHRARSTLGSCLIVVQLRDPIERAVSNWRFSAAHGFEDRPLEEALVDNLTRSRAWNCDLTSVSPFAYLERGRYAHYLQPWWQSFGDDVILRFLADGPTSPDQVKQLYARLGVDASFVPPDLGAVNASEGPTPVLDASLVDRLRAYFAEADAALSQRLGRPLPWPTA